MQEGVSLLREWLGSIEFLEERVHLFVLVGEVCLGYSRARYRRPSPGFDPAHPRFSIGIVWIGGTVESTYTVYIVDGVGTLPQGGKLLSCCCLSIRIHKHKVDLGFELIHHHWCPKGVEDLLDLVHCPCPSGSAFHV